MVEVGSWHGDDWFVNSGLQAGDRVVIDNLIKMQQGLPIVHHPADTTGENAPGTTD